MKNITIIGSGSFGCALAHTFSKKNNIKMWSYTKEEYESINNNHKCLEINEIKLDEKIRCYLDLEESIKNSDIIILATISSAIKDICKKIKNYIDKQDIILVSKGIDKDKLLSDDIYEILNINPSLLMGPSFAYELGLDMPTYVNFYGNKEIIKDLETDNFKIIYNNDYIGMQVGATFKNIIALACGIVEGMNYKLNTISYIFTEGLNEIKKIGLCLGANADTFSSLSTLGDLYLTSIGNNSRNKKAGILIGKGYKIDEISKQLGTIEGLDNLKSAIYIINKYDLNCPIIKKLYKIIYENENTNILIEK